MERLIEGFALADPSYSVTKSCNGKIIWQCPIYATWKSMIYRCYNPKQKLRARSYADVSVTEEWHRFSNFEPWFRHRYFSGCCLDKDLIDWNNNLYGPDTCSVLTEEVNNFLVGLHVQGMYLKGVVYYPDRGLKVWKSQINLGNGSVCLGWFYSEMEAHVAWQKAKAERAFYLSNLEKDIKNSQNLIKFGNSILQDIEAKKPSFYKEF